MTNAQTEARAIARQYTTVPAEDRINLSREIATALAAKNAELSRTFDLLSLEQQRAERAEKDRDEWVERCRASVVAFDEQKARAERAEAELAEARRLLEIALRETAPARDAAIARAERAEAQLAKARTALEWHPIETAPLNTIVDLWCTYADAPASWGNDRPAGEIVHNRHKSKEHGWFGNESNDGIPQANGPDLVPVAWRWPAPEIPLEMMERFVAARRALEAQGGKNG